MTLSIKPGVRLQGLRPELLLAIIVVNDVYSRHGVRCEITSVIEGAHSHTSLHYTGCAVDFSIRDLVTQQRREDVRIDVRASLSDDYDVVLEEDHLHVEYQPRRLI